MLKLLPWAVLLCGAVGTSVAQASHEAFSRNGKCVSQDRTYTTSKAVLRGDDTGLQTPLGALEESANQDVPSPHLEIQPLIISGPFINRVDLVFFSDGYTVDEKDKFIEDAMRLADDISGNQTFNTVKPLMNFWAAFSPSEESGVGKDGKPNKTPFGLYRDGTELRAVYYAYPEVAAAACESMGQQCDYPILLGNDPLYGGLGGKFTVITSSILNGPQILRHELGHSIIPVGEEYDGGFAYFGVNAYHDLSEPVPWAHWLSASSSEHDLDSEKQTPKVERSIMPMQTYPWTLLNTSTSWSTRFVSSGTFSRHLVRFSLSGLPSKTDLKVELDDVDLSWKPKVGLGVDRWHYDVHLDRGLEGGEHELRFTLLNKEREGIAQLCSAEILEFGDENEFNSTPGHYGVFPTFSDTNETSYRPTNEDCLMRIVTTPNFCKVCLEGLWHALLSRVNLIDGVSESCHQDHGSTKVLNASLVPLAQLRADADAATTLAALDESYTITWTKDGKVLEEGTNKTTVEVPSGKWKVGDKVVLDVKFSTKEVKVDKEGHLEDQLEYVLVESC
ncbi:hypothetical protein K435DRAFT_754775 [Dendrothele bispora CBS 962.96]|uniref:IgA peptidase M64 n=1 Tax=Dendrothele bispora (strain CBS 962.96) TaxID=1314807 RepID=A0A4S8M3U7_DENBC|nr:hypothetical protein K435DRAFT_754775 [Dendrothele bispora CBS 962.96]